MIRNNSISRLNSRAVSPLAGVILMVAVTVVIFALVGLLIMVAGLALIDSFLTLTPYLIPIFILHILGHIINIYLKKRDQQSVSLSDCVEFEEEHHPIRDDEIEEDEIHVIKTTLDLPDNVSIDAPLTVAPSHANPRNWTLATRLQEDNAVKFVINTEYIPSDIESDETLLVPNKQHGSLNGTYAQNEITRLTVYDNQLNEVASYYMSAGEKRTN